MKLVSVLIKGPINSDLNYALSEIENINEGSWQLSISTVGFTYTSPRPQPPRHLAISSNYVMGKFVDENKQTSAGQAVLNICIFGGKAQGTKVVIGMKQQTFFTINNAQQNFSLRFTDVETNTYAAGADVVVLALLRRMA